MFLDFGRHAGSRIREGQLDIGSGRDLLFPAVLKLADLHIFSLNDQVAALRHGVPGVENQVEDNLLDLSPVGQNRLQVHVLLEGKMDGGVDKPLEHLVHFQIDLVEVNRLGLGNLLLAEDQQLLGQLSALPNRLLNIFQFLVDGIIFFHLIHNKFHVASDNAEQVVKIMGHAPGQPAHGVHFLGQVHLLFLLE